MYKIFLGHFLVLKPFPGDPFLDPPISGTPYLKKATEVSFIRSVCVCVFNRWTGLCAAQVLQTHDPLHIQPGHICWELPPHRASKNLHHFPKGSWRKWIRAPTSVTSTESTKEMPCALTKSNISYFFQQNIGTGYQRLKTSLCC